MPAVTLSPSRPAARAGTRNHLGALLRLWRGRLRARRALAALHPEQLREAGLDAFRVRDEIAKPFWRA